MSPSRSVLLAAALVAVSFALIAEEPETNRSTARTAPETNQGEVHPRPTPVRPALPQPPTVHPIPGTTQRQIVQPMAPPSAKALPTPPPGTWGIVSSGDGGGGMFRDTDSDGEAWLGADSIGVQGFGSTAGGEFRSTLFSGAATLGYGDFGIYARGEIAGGYFSSLVTSSYAHVGSSGFGIHSVGVDGGGWFEDFDDSASTAVGLGDRGIQASGDEMGGFFEDSDGSGFAHLGWGDTGVFGRGNVAGGVFNDRDDSGYARAGYGNRGVDAGGTEMGGYFDDTDGTGYLRAAVGDRGLEAGGSDMGGYFADTGGTAYAHVGWGTTGILGRGDAAGGVFEDKNSSGYAKVGFGDRGVEAGGSDMGGYFHDSDETGYAKAGFGNRGLEAGGTEMGGYFADTDGSAYAKIADNVYGVSGFGTSAGGYFADVDAEHSGHAYIGIGDTGVLGRGHIAGGVFEDNNGSGWAKIGFERVEGADPGGDPNAGEYGVYGGGSFAGAYFENSTYGSYGYVARGGLGFWGFGSLAGGSFEDTDSGNWGAVGFDTSKIYGVGAVDFVQNHPFDPDSVIVYAAPEGDEVATYTRGTATLSGGEARVQLGKTFRWVTNPDIGLTAYLTPVGDWCDLYVAEKGTEEIVVRTRDGSDCTFDYLVYGLRIGFEESTVVQEKTREAYIPAMKSHRDRVSRSPDLAQYTALARWTAARKALGDEEPLGLSRAHALRDLIQEYDPAVHGPLDTRRTAERTVAGSSPDTATAARGDKAGESPADHALTGRRSVADVAGLTGSEPDRDVYARSFRPSAADLASLLEVSEPVEPGDVVAIDPEVPGMMRRAGTAADPTVVGVVAASPGVVLGSSDTGAVNEAAVAFAGVASCKVDAGYGPVYPGDLLVSSPTPGHAMRADVPLPGTVLGKALEEIPAGSGVIRVLVMLR